MEEDATCHFHESCAYVLSCFICVQLFTTLWIVALQVPLSMGFSRQEYRSGLPFPPPAALPEPRTADREDGRLAPKILAGSGCQVLLQIRDCGGEMRKQSQKAISLAHIS